MITLYYPYNGGMNMKPEMTEEEWQEACGWEEYHAKFGLTPEQADAEYDGRDA